MTCSACGEANRDTAKFCLRCGQRFSMRCADCAAELLPTARFCDQCGTAVPPSSAATASSTDHLTSPRSYTPPHLAAKILTGRSALEGERKQVTVLFADVAGFTALSERLDPEDVHDIMDRCFRILTDEVHRYEGTINQYTGDGIMALFGAPIAHEDAPERAVRAALGAQASLRRLGDELRAERHIDLQMRMGLNSGPVVVGKIGDDLRMDYTAVGDTTNLAARLQAAAAPGGILVSDSTAKLIAGRFATEPVGPLVLKGKAQPVDAYAVLRAVPRVPLMAPSGRGLTPLIGRTSELAALETVFSHACVSRGQIAFVVGEAGIGKSRLIHEFRRRIEHQELLWFQGRIVPAGRAGGGRRWALADAWFSEPLGVIPAQPVALREATVRSLRALGVATQQQVKNHFIRRRYPGLAGGWPQLEAEGVIVPVELGLKGDWYVHAEDVRLLEQIEAGEFDARTTLLSPFDNLICDRNRTLALWNFDFKLEIYVPKSKRWGYFVMPLLHGEQIVARFDLAVDRNARVLDVIGERWEAGWGGTRRPVRPTKRALDDLGSFLGVEVRRQPTIYR